MKRPPCENCGGEVPVSVWSDKDERAEREYIAATKTKHRPLYCSPRCFRIVRDHRCGQVHDAAHAGLACGEEHGTEARAARLRERARAAVAGRHKRAPSRIHKPRQARAQVRRGESPGRRAKRTRPRGR